MLLDLPAELIAYLLGFLSPQDWAQIISCNKLLYEIGKSPDVFTYAISPIKIKDASGAPLTLCKYMGLDATRKVFEDYAGPRDLPERFIEACKTEYECNFKFLPMGAKTIGDIVYGAPSGEDSWQREGVKTLVFGMAVWSNAREEINNRLIEGGWDDRILDEMEPDIFTISDKCSPFMLFSDSTPVASGDKCEFEIVINGIQVRQPTNWTTFDYDPSAIVHYIPNYLIAADWGIIPAHLWIMEIETDEDKKKFRIKGTTKWYYLLPYISPLACWNINHVEVIDDLDLNLM